MILLLVAEIIGLLSLVGGGGGGFAPGVMLVGVFAAGFVVSLLGCIRTPVDRLALAMLLTHAGAVGLYVLLRIGDDTRSWWGKRSESAQREERRAEAALVGDIAKRLGAGKEAEALATLRENKELPLSGRGALAEVFCGMGERVPGQALIQELRRHGAADGELLGAAAQCTRSAVAALLDASVAPDARDQAGQTALMTGTHMEALTLLLDRGASPNARTKAGETPLMFHRTPDVTRLLLQRGADPKAVDALGNTALHVDGPSPALPGCLSLLLEAGAPPNARNQESNTPLHLIAIRALHREDGWYHQAAEVLVRHGADPFLTTKDGKDTLQLLMDRYCDLRPVLGWPRLDMAGPRGSALLVYAIEHGSWDAVDVLAQGGVNPALPDGDGRSPLQAYVSVKGELHLDSDARYQQLRRVADRFHGSP
jgi:ankyrin repeat protein